MVKDVPNQITPGSLPNSLPEQSVFIPIDDYLWKYEAEEREKCKGINYELLNETMWMENDDLADVADEIEVE